jgi:hypothetical protein
VAINEEVYKNLGLKGFLGALPERIYKHLGSLGHVGTISDRLFKEGGYLSYITNLLGVVSRYFVTLDPVLNSSYEMAQPITFTGDFEIEVEFSTTSTGGENTLCGEELYLKFRVANGSLQLLIGDGTQWRINATSGVGVFRDGKLHKAKLTKLGDVYKVFADGVEVISTSNTATVLPKVSFIGSARSNAYYFDGIIANAKFTDQSGASDVVTTFKLDQATANTESSVEGNNSVTYNNIPQSARDLYTLDGNIWTDSAGNTIEVAS